MPRLAAATHPGSRRDGFVRMRPLAEPLLRDAAPEPPAGTARLLLTSHVLTKFGSKAWEVPQPA